MRAVITYLPLLACGAMMLFICIPMMRHMSKGESSEDATTREEIAALREQIAELRADRALGTKEPVDG